MFSGRWRLSRSTLYALSGEGADRAWITLKFFIYTLAGSLFMLVGLIYLYLHTPGIHTFNIHALYQAGHSMSAPKQGLVFWMFFVAFCYQNADLPIPYLAAGHLHRGAPLKALCCFRESC